MSLGLAWRFTKTHRWVLTKNVGLFGLYGALYCKTEYQLNNPDSDEAILKKAAIKQRYCYLMAGLQIVPLIGCVAASRSVAKVRNVPWLPLLSRALDGGTQLGTAAAWSYFVTKELTNREHCAITLTGMYTGYTYAGILGQTGTLSVRWLKRGAIGGFAAFLVINFCGWAGEVFSYLRREDLTRQDWHNFPVMQHLNRRILKWCELEGWIDYFKASQVRELVIQVRDEMDELEYLLYQAKIDPSDCEFVDWTAVNDEMFDVLGELKTGRHQFDRIVQHETTGFGTIMGNPMNPK